MDGWMDRWMVGWMNECMYLPEMNVCDRETVSMHYCMEYLHFGYAVCLVSLSLFCLCMLFIFLYLALVLFLLFVFSYYSIQCFPSIQCLYRLQTVLLSRVDCVYVSPIRVMYLYLLDKNETRALGWYAIAYEQASESNERALWTSYVYLIVYFEAFRSIFWVFENIVYNVHAVRDLERDRNRDSERVRMWNVCSWNCLNGWDLDGKEWIITNELQISSNKIENFFVFMIIIKYFFRGIAC